MRSFVEVCMRRDPNVNVDKIKVVAMNGEEGLKCGVLVDGMRLQHISEFKYFRLVLDESGTDGVECSMKVASYRMVAGAIRSLDNVKGLQLECARVLHDTLLVPLLIIISLGLELYRWTTSGLVGIRKMDKVPSARIK